MPSKDRHRGRVGRPASAAHVREHRVQSRLKGEETRPRPRSGRRRRAGHRAEDGVGGKGSAVANRCRRDRIRPAQRRRDGSPRLERTSVEISVSWTSRTAEQSCSSSIDVANNFHPPPLGANVPPVDYKRTPRLAVGGG
ncbi:hypothetical protein C8035_v002924 [Colletotrichum spinosum]|uniref:Uncharacterized protein n=1 Tax=Colletotrichum spinosum TaxID=1347390 RepID=A0A4V3HQA8_9PEZI|nr:hypothetical protein C8035_v002924 [Colletotrichum spinosum]